MTGRYEVRKTRGNVLEAVYPGLAEAKAYADQLDEAFGEAMHVDDAEAPASQRRVYRSRDRIKP